MSTDEKFYRCAGKACPGLPWKASERPHPDSCNNVASIDMRMRSGQEDSTDPVVALLYVLMRDHLPIADIEEAVATVLGGTLYEFTNGWLAKYAIDVRERLAGKHETKAQQRRREENTL